MDHCQHNLRTYAILRFTCKRWQILLLSLSSSSSSSLSVWRMGVVVVLVWPWGHGNVVENLSNQRNFMWKRDDTPLCNRSCSGPTHTLTQQKPHDFLRVKEEMRWRERHGPLTFSSFDYFFLVFIFMRISHHFILQRDELPMRWTRQHSSKNKRIFQPSFLILYIFRAQFECVEMCHIYNLMTMTHPRTHRAFFFCCSIVAPLCWRYFEKYIAL